MAITAISRDWGIDPSIVRVVTTDTLATITATGYLTAQAANIQTLNNGPFQWQSDDYILIAYNGGEGFFTRNATTLTFDPAGGTFNSQVTLTSAQILAMNATPVQIIAAPAANKAIIINRIWNAYHFGTAQYAAGGAIGLEWGNTAALAGPAASNTLAAATFNAYAASNAFDLTPDGTDTLANIMGKGVFMSNGTAAFTTGDGTLTVNVNYSIVTA